MTQWPIGLLERTTPRVSRPSWIAHGGSPSPAARRVSRRHGVSGPGGRDHDALSLLDTRSPAAVLPAPHAGTGAWIAVLAVVDLAVATALGLVILAIAT